MTWWWWGMVHLTARPSRSSSWWFNQPNSNKNMRVRQIGSFPQVSGWKEKIFETTTYFILNYPQIFFAMENIWKHPASTSVGHLPAPSKGCCLNPKGWCIGIPYHPWNAPLGRSRYLSILNLNLSSSRGDLIFIARMRPTKVGTNDREINGVTLGP